VEDERDFRKQVVRSLLPFNEITEAVSLKDARQAIARSSFDVAILDKKLEDGEALELIPELRANHPNCAILILTGHSDKAKTTATRYLDAGAHDYVEKSEDAVLELKIRIPAAVAMLALKRRSESLEQLLKTAFRHDIVGKSESTRRLRERILSLKGSNFPVLITGESGTGKEGVARMLNKIEENARRPLVIVNAGAIHENLIESELFGVKKGGYTGANSDRPGKFEIAHQGDLFLDEIGDLPLPAQVKLLRVIEHGEFYRVGDSVLRRVSVRLIAATNKDLEQLVREGKFREDLYYRINVIPIQTTPLRERREDIPDIARFVLTLAGEGRFTIDPSAFDAFAEYHWPGNVRELVNAVERATIEAKLRGSTCLQMSHFSFVTNRGRMVGRSNLPERSEDVSYAAMQDYVTQAERDYMARALTFFDGSVDRLAKHMGKSRSALFRRAGNVGLTGQRPGLTTAGKEEEHEEAAHH
jgi:DNA-binding NtrC family response regulator